jgi:hypothetical protein
MFVNRVQPQTAAGKLTNLGSPRARSAARIATPLIVLFAVLVCSAAPASAETISPWWHLLSFSRPSYLPPAGQGYIAVVANNLGDADAGGATTPVQITDTLPAGLKEVSFEAYAGQEGFYPGAPGDRGPVECSPVASSQVTCTFAGTLPPYDQIELVIGVKVQSAHTGEVNQVSISGGGAPSAAVRRPITVSGEPMPFGVPDYELAFEGANGAPETQAGSHPFQITNTLMFNQQFAESLAGDQLLPSPVGLPKNIEVKLPPGLVGNPTPIPRCTLGQFLTKLEGGNRCPEQTAVGVATIVVLSPNVGKTGFTVPLFNLEPGYGEPARFGFFEPTTRTPIYLDTSIRSGPGEDYGVTVSSPNTTQLVGLLSSEVTFWGVPGDPRHNNARGWGCLERARGQSSLLFSCTTANQPHPPALLISPTECSGAPLESSAMVNSWVPPSNFVTVSPTAPLVTLDGCNHLVFGPTLRAEPTTNRASAPSGLELNIGFHDEGLTSAEGVAQSQLKNTVVTLPEGFTINPSAGVGLGGCSEADYARETLESAPGAGCPNDSKLGTVEIETPLLTQKIDGNIFIAQPYENPFGSLVGLYIVAKNPETGVLVKLAGRVTPNAVTGRLVTTFANNPQLPFDRFNFHFREGQQAPLVTPSTCGSYAIEALLTPWSQPLSAFAETSSFPISSGAGGGACPAGGVPFNPGITAYPINIAASAFSPFYLHLTRSDSDQEISGFSTNLPPGLTGDLTGIQFCPEADIEAARHKTGGQEEANPSCPAASQVGHTLVGTGVGAVLAYVPGKIYLAGSFQGAPFSLVSVTSAVVGPFDLGTVVLRFGLNINPYTAQVSVSPTSSEPIPTIINGIVTHVRDIRIYIDGVGGDNHFTLNPTSCNPLAVSSTLTSDLGQSATVSSPLQATNCQALKFAPKFAASTSGKTGRARGASLTVKLTYPNAPQGSQANIARVKVDLPKQLPSRLTTLQKACTAAQFNTNPAGCPAASFIGHAKAVTPLIPVPLEGPAIFVSHGGEAFPSLIMVLKGYGVTIDLVGSTNISKSGITSSTFKAVPDQPVGSFELTLPEGKYSALAANGNLCTSKLAMPTEFVAQNGAKINESTPIAVTGCSTGIAIVSHKIKGRALTVSVSVPAAGILTASGNGLSRSSKSAKGRETLTFKLNQKKAGKLSTTVKVAFTPSTGKDRKKQAKSAKVRFAK